MPSQAGPWFRRSRNRWYYTVDGQQTPLNATDPKDEAGAWREMLERLNRVADRMAAPPPPPAAAHGVRPGTVAELIPVYEDVLSRRVEAVSVRQYATYLRWALKRFGPLTPEAISPTDVEDAIRGERWADNTRRMCAAVVGGFVRWCGLPGFRLRVPPSSSRGAEVVVNADEYERLLSDARGDFKPLLRFLWLTWCRPGEARQLTVEAVDWDHGTITLKKHKTRKKGKQRIIFLCPTAVAVLTAQRARHGTGPLFRDVNGNAFGDQAVRARMRRLRERVGVKGDVIPYSFRHSGATRALEEGVPDSDVAALLGHASTAMIHKHYSHVSANARRLKDVAARVNGRESEAGRC